MIQLDFKDKRPISEQIQDVIKNLIIKGAFKENEKIPSVRELAGSLAINPNTIQKAYKELENEGYIYSQKAKGNFVAPAGSELKDRKESVLKEQLSEIVRELYYIGAEKESLKKEIDEIYRGGTNHD
ncbi:MAG: GntR family transcriptional regulator [Bacillota bacterium]|nr:GntR family transcriptional regulator [Bacillota bacterium]